MKKSERTVKHICIFIIGVLFILSVLIIMGSTVDLFEILFHQKKILPSVLINKATDWKYLDEGKAPENGNIWTMLDYTCEGWKEESGYFATASLKKEAKALQAHKLNDLDSSTAEEQSSSTFFFRSTFEVQGVKKIAAIRGKIDYFGAVLIYINGEIVYDGNIPAGGYQSNYESGSSQPITDVVNDEILITDVRCLKEGENSIAIELHQEKEGLDRALLALEYLQAVYAGEDEETETKKIDTSQLKLSLGENSTQMRVSWLSEENGPYYIEYTEKKDYKGNMKRFVKNAKQVLMGKIQMNEKEFLYQANIDRLKSNTEYVYRVVRVGGIESSRLMELRIGSRNTFSFFARGKHQLGSFEKDDPRTLFSTMTADGKEPVDFIYTPGDQMDETYDFYTTYNDALIICLNSNNTCKAQKAFMEEAIQKMSRKWIIVTMQQSVFNGNELTWEEERIQMRENYEQMFQDLNVDLALSGQEYLYAGTKWMDAERLTDVSYLHITVTNQKILIDAYKEGTEEIIDTLVIEK